MNPGNSYIGKILLLCLVVSLLACSDEFRELGPDPSETYLKFHGGSYENKGADILKTPTGYLLLGSTKSASEGEKWEAYLVATDESGERLWSQTIAVADSSASSGEAHDIIQLDDGSLLIAGSITHSNGKQDAWLIKASANGDDIWQKSFGEENSSETGNAIALIGQEQVLLLGTTDNVDPLKPETGFADVSDLYLIKADLNQDGGMIWEKSFGYTGPDIAADILALKDGNFAVLGSTTFPEGTGSQDFDIFITLVNEDGNAYNTEVFPKAGTDEEASQIQQGADNNLYVIGSSYPQSNFTGIPNVYFLTSSLSLDINQSLSKSLDRMGKAESIFTLSNGNILITGASFRNDLLRSQAFMMKVDPDGNEQAFSDDFGFSDSNTGHQIISPNEEDVIVVASLNFGGNTMMGHIKTKENFAWAD